jgi:hypothetical protein
MSAVQVRPFRRSDRDQLTQLVKAHAEAVVPGMTIRYEDYRAFLPAVGFRELTRTQRGWTRPITIAA